ncbi:MAG TPA: FKBP-type peptidyl-prolyl cis-trans isomerase [Streptosporangiaceae bacterium]|nr:FKBP-type peptidyl-prolyl cis-trans isomerase [Streptosporangiaceae bacterium]
MRRIAIAVLAPIAAVAVLAGCGGGGSSGNANDAVKVTGSFNKAPTVTIPAEQASTNLVISKPIRGSGAALKAGDATLANVAVYKWSGTSHSLVDSTFGTGPQMIPADNGLPGLITALKGARLGSRVVAVLPPKYGYGTSGESSLGVTGSDTLVWVIDLLQQYPSTQSASGTQVSNGGGSLPTVTAKPGQAPVVTIPKTAPPGKLSVTTLIKGSGRTLATGDTVVAQYVGAIWRTGQVFASTWPATDQPDGAPFSFRIGGDVLTGLSEGLTGVTVGSRVMVVIPPSLGYGPEGGNSSAGIEKNDSLVFIVDVIGSLPAGSS